jgi:hypothetical protein
MPFSKIEKRKEKHLLSEGCYQWEWGGYKERV